MNCIEVIAPIKKPEDIEIFSKFSACRKFYVYHKKFMDGNFDYIDKFVESAQKNSSQIFINFKHNIVEKDLDTIKNMINYLSKINIDGIFVNSYAVLNAVKSYKLPFKVIVDSYFDIHNLAGIDFMNQFHKIDAVLLTEEIYLKNIEKIKKYTNLPLAIDTDNLPWFVENVVKSNIIDSVVIKGKFSESEDILDSILLVEKILENPKMYKNQKFPFKHVRKSIYQTNHFSGDVMSAEGQDFKFSRNIINFDWKYKKTNLRKNTQYSKDENYKINFRLSELAQLKILEKYIDKIGFNPVDSIEYGEILSTADLSKHSFEQVINKVKKFCERFNIEFNLSTPRILIERDFDRVFEYCKDLALRNPVVSSVIINNIGFFWNVINDNEFSKIPIEIGQGLNLLNSVSISCLHNLHSINAIDFTSNGDIFEISDVIKNVKKFIKYRKITIAGNLRVPALGLCPLNSDSAVVSRLSCKAPCHRGGFALHDPSINKVFPFTCDGFCRMHMFEDSILENYDKIDDLLNIGINEFIFDFSALNAKFVPILLTNYLNKRSMANNNSLLLC